MGPGGGAARARVAALVPWGVLLGGAIGWQFYMSSELLAGTFLAALEQVCSRSPRAPVGNVLSRLVPTLAASGAAVVPPPSCWRLLSS